MCRHEEMGKDETRCRHQLFVRTRLHTHIDISLDYTAWANQYISLYVCVWLLYTIVCSMISIADNAWFIAFIHDDWWCTRWTEHDVCRPSLVHHNNAESSLFLRESALFFFSLSLFHSIVSSFLLYFLIYLSPAFVRSFLSSIVMLHQWTRLRLHMAFSH